MMEMSKQENNIIELTPFLHVDSPNSTSYMYLTPATTWDSAFRIWKEKRTWVPESSHNEGNCMFGVELDIEEAEVYEGIDNQQP